MGIDIQCPSCATIGRVPDAYAGRSINCKRCGASFQVPGSPVAPVVANPHLPLRPTPRPGATSKAWITRSIIAGIYLAGLVGAYLAYLHLAPERPAVTQPPAPVAVRAAGPVAPEAAEPSEALVRALLAFGFLIVVPMLVPSVLSLTGALSVGRWVCASGFCLFMAMMIGVLALTPHGRIFEDAFQKGTGGIPFLGSGVAFFAFGIGGCLLAAVVHPKKRP